MAKPNRKCFKPIVKPLTTTEMIALIQNGESQENYATWAKSAPQAVRLALAENKYELDRLSKDEDPVIVVTVMKKSKEHLRKIMQSAIKIELVRSAISYDITIDKDILENQIQQAEKRKKTWPSHYTRYIKALQAKLNNEEWAKELTLKEVEHKLYMDETLAKS